MLTDILGFHKIGEEQADESGQTLHIFESGEGGAGTEVHVKQSDDGRRERPGRGSVHHVAFRVKDEEELKQWHEIISENGFSNSGIVERYYFKALYFREPNGILLNCRLTVLALPLMNQLMSSAKAPFRRISSIGGKRLKRG